MESKQTDDSRDAQRIHNTSDLQQRVGRALVPARSGESVKLQIWRRGDARSGLVWSYSTDD